MKSLSYTQEFFMCAINEKGKLPLFMEDEIYFGILAGALLELISDGFIQADEKDKYSVVKALTADKVYLKALYATIDAKPAKLSVIVERYFASKLSKQLFATIGESLADAGYADESVRQGFFGDRTLYIPKSDCVNTIVEKVRAELLESGTVTDETIILCAMLEKSGMIKDYFSKFESDRLKIRLKEIKTNDQYAVICEILKYYDQIVAALIVIISAAT